MKKTEELKNRDLYLKKVIAFKDTEPVKVITGIRRCGKSSVLDLMAEYLKKSGVSDDRIVKMNFESYEFRNMTAKDVYDHVKGKVIKGERMYLFFDEPQKVAAWEDAVNAFRVDFDCDI